MPIAVFYVYFDIFSFVVIILLCAYHDVSINSIDFICTVRISLFYVHTYIHEGNL